MPRLATVNDIINRVAVEVGLNKSADPVASTDETFVQLRGLLDSAGQELVRLQQWQIMSKAFEITTAAGDTGTYDLPDDFSYMVDQTGWDLTNNVSIGGPLSAQDWAYLEGRDLVSQTIYASFRLDQNKLDLYPQPPPEGITLKWEYQSRDWLAQQLDLTQTMDIIATGSDICLYEPILIVKFLKVKFLEAKGLDASAARVEFENMMGALSGQDEGAAILSASNNSRGFPYLSPYYSTPDTGYGA